MKLRLIGIMFTAGVIIGGCNAMNQLSSEEQAVQVSEETAPSIMVDMINTEGKSVGKATLNETEKGVTFGLQAEGLEPGEKAIHIHETGSCKIPEFTSAGAHLNPEHKKHGFDNPEGFHAGDLPNLTVDPNGSVNLELTVEAVTLKQGEKNSLLDDDGSALVIHEGKDDYKTDPSGNSGKRIVCGEILP